MAANAIDHFSWFQWVGPLKTIPDFIVHAFFVAAVLVVGAFLAHSKLKKVRENVLPDSKMNVKTVFELYTDFILGIMRGVMGDHAPHFLPLIGSVFIYVFVSNAIGLIPGFQISTTNLSTNLAVSLTVFVYYNAMGIKENGLGGYMKHFMGPIIWLAPLMLIIELIGHVVRPLSLSLRLAGNMNGDHMVLGIFSELVPIGVPVIFLFLGLFVSLVQAFVFSLLSMIYIAMATAHDH